MKKNTLAQLTDRILAVCPIHGVSYDSDGQGVAIQFADGVSEDQIRAANKIASTYDPNAPTSEDIGAERDRRLGLGFPYDFGDARGAHHIGTSPSDMIGWGEVSTYAGAMLDSGDVTTTIAIVTDTGPCVVTAPEWRAIEIAAAVFRQPLWARSFVLSQSLPTDYTSDAHWS
jgi:hypothetical protein